MTGLSPSQPKAAPVPCRHGLSEDWPACMSARIEELEADLVEWKQVASVEAGLRREFAGRVGDLEHPFRNVDELDWKHLLSFIPDSGHGKFWKAVFEEVRAVLKPKGAV